MTPRTKNVLKFFVSFAVTLAAVGALGIYVLVPSIQKDIGPDPGSESHLFQIAKAYITYCHDEVPGHTLPAKDGETVHDVALLFAKKYGLIEANFWLVKSDPVLFGRDLPLLVMTTNSSEPSLAPLFDRLTLSVQIAANITPPVSAKTPIVWTRGLQPDGTWAFDSPFNGNGGYIAFYDGHVEWFTSLDGKKGTPFIKYGTTEGTVNVREALPPGTVILPAEPNRLPVPQD